MQQKELDAAGVKCKSITRDFTAISGRVQGYSPPVTSPAEVMDRLWLLVQITKRFSQTWEKHAHDACERNLMLDLTDAWISACELLELVHAGRVYTKGLLETPFFAEATRLRFFDILNSEYFLGFSTDVIKFLFLHYEVSERTQKEFRKLKVFKMAILGPRSALPVHSDVLRLRLNTEHFYIMHLYFVGPLGALLQSGVPRLTKKCSLRRLPVDLVRLVAECLVDRYFYKTMEF